MKITLFKPPTDERIVEMIKTIEDIRDYELSYGYNEILTETAELLKSVMREMRIERLLHKER